MSRIPQSIIAQMRDGEHRDADAAERCSSAAPETRPAPGFAALLDIMDEPSPATDVRAILLVCRARGYAFERAWTHALRSLPQAIAGIEEWRFLLHRNKHVWKAAYEREN